MKKSTIFFYILTSFFFVSILILAYLNYFSSSKTPLSSTVTENISLIPTEQVIQTKPANDWKTYTSEDFTYLNNIFSGYTFKYPNNCVLKDEALTCTLKNSVATLLINAAGHGGGEGNYQILVDNQTKISNSIEGKLTAIEDIDNKVVFGTYWINKTPELAQEPIFGFEFSNIALNDFDEFKDLFNGLLSTFMFTNNDTYLSTQDINQGWYWGTEDKKKINTPVNWVFTEAGRSSCWHSLDKECNFSP